MHFAVAYLGIILFVLIGTLLASVDSGIEARVNVIESSLAGNDMAINATTIVVIQRPRRTRPRRTRRRRTKRWQRKPSIILISNGTITQNSIGCINFTRP